jgi:molybdopterin synthase catalytic subunit
VSKLYYEAHPTMAIKKLREIAEYCVDKYSLEKVLIVHRIGEVVSI